MSYKYDVIILTEDRYEDPKKITPYISNVLLEDNLVKSALESVGLIVGRVSWSSSSFDWTSTRVALFRTVWDYFYRYTEFDQWLNTVSRQTRLIHSAELIRWNLDKIYLKELESNGIRIPETTIIDINSRQTLREHFSTFGQDKMVLKPCISGCARHTYVLTAQNIDDYEQIFQELILKEKMMIQPFLKNIITKGEVAHMVIDGQYSHSVLKKVKPGEFRVQDDFGGSAHPYVANPKEISFVHDVMKACKYPATYGRVDVVWDNDDNLAVSEIEMIEPEMWFRFCKEATYTLAEKIIKELEN